MPHPPLGFEIPDEWWTEAGMVGFVPSADAYPHADDSLLVIEACPRAEVAPIIRVPSVVKDAHGFDRVRLVRVLSGLRSGAVLPPVDVVKLPRATEEGFRYRLIDGFHRFYGSMAAGFTHIPGSIVPNWRNLPGSPFTPDV